MRLLDLFCGAIERAKVDVHVGAKQALAAKIHEHGAIERTGGNNDGSD